MSYMRFSLTTLLLLSSFGCLLAEEFREKINLFLIFVCSCPVVTLPNRGSTDVSVKMLPRRSCSGIGGDEKGSTRQACIL